MAYSGNRGLTRIIKAAGYSWQGLRSTFRHEAAFRQELLAMIVLVPLALWLGSDGVERALLIGSLFLILIVELLNSGIEAAIDRIGQEFHDLSARAKDMGSAAVLLSILHAVAVWALVLM
ncbi:diacylglycerol kinase [Ectothiorhodospira lacustris]|uniref:diacylglycerol kinase n=1 Tax=Ectothiorhodospira lacustris TaxID=2899127 RepID=UPI001EE93E6D|nr:diacylglycerol kinase [Ectothiorhodospira lacustris]MCG5501021.1 diacylglycerol kinase [Ectothiorhodospira lacustris]MCG5508879.1 diacylglycerol kinase [Ectothiorhodospira lacustris]MCG5520670.1 diacylglycerol kinase [Ectothiorhodospira lacustris]